MASITGGSLDMDFVSRTGNPVLSILAPVSKNFLVNFISRSFVAIDSSGKSTGSGNSS